MHLNKNRGKKMKVFHLILISSLWHLMDGSTNGSICSSLPQGSWKACPTNKYMSENNLQQCYLDYTKSKGTYYVMFNDPL